MNMSELSMAGLPEMLTSYGIKVALAIAIFIVGKMLAKWITTIVEKIMNSRDIDVTVSRFAKNILYYMIVTIVVIAALGQLGVQTASFVAIIGAAGLAVGLALQGSLANFAAGVLLILFRPCKVGDFVEVAGVAGSVTDISIFSTTLRTGDNKTIIIANSSVLGNTIVNYSTEPQRRVDLVVGVSYDANIAQVKEELMAIVKADERILTDRDVTIGVSELGDSSVNLVLRPWVNSGDYWAVLFDLNETIKTRFDEVGIGIPYPTMDINMSKVSD